MRYCSVTRVIPRKCLAIASLGAAQVRALYGLNQWSEELTSELKLKIENFWHDKLYERPFSEDSCRQKMYVLSMIPYPSGKLHMGHVRVYTISDAIARFHRMTGKNVFHPMGWDAFGLPAENAALDRGLNPDSWTQKNIASMKDNMEQLNLSFNWQREFATCDSDYYKWTQFLFLKLYENDLVYQKEAVVNWDPIDQTVLAEEQVDQSGCSWRSGARVEKKLLKQWFIRTTRYSKKLYEGLDDPDLKDWRDIVKLQKHWIGECTGTSIDFEIVDDCSSIKLKEMTIWMRQPEYVDKASFVAVQPKSLWDVSALPGQSRLPYMVKNPFTTDILPVFVTDAVDYPEGSNCYLGIPEISQIDKAFADSVSLPSSTLKPVMTELELIEFRQKICAEARKRGIGGYQTSSKLRDWLISRQRYWGTPIPMVYCRSCGGPHPVPESDLPVKLPGLRKIQRGSNPLLDAKDWLRTTCPKCGGHAERETDTMDTFVDSSWYFVRFLDPDNVDIPFRPEKAKRFMPVDIYIGGKEHAVLHLYYARFFNYFLHAAGLLPHKEPFKRLLVQGMVRGKTYRLKTSGEYLKPELVDETKKTAVHKETGEPVIVAWEKMSKSKFNGVDPVDMFREFGTDTTRLILLADVAPTSSRNWSRDTFPGILNWQHRLWLTLRKFLHIRNQNLAMPQDTTTFTKEDEYMFDSRNFYVRGANFNFLHAYQLSVAISKMQGLTNSLRKVSDCVIALSQQYERALATQIMLIAPIAPHFASELWCGFLQAPNRLSSCSDILWDEPVLLQPWPKIDGSYCLPLNIKVNGQDIAEVKLPKREIDHLTHEKAMKLALGKEAVVNVVSSSKVLQSYIRVQKNYDVLLSITTDKMRKTKAEVSEKVQKEELVEDLTKGWQEVRK